MILYKYRQNSPYGSDLRGPQIWLAKSSSLNDPCECTLHSLGPEWIAQKVREMKSAQMTGALVGIPGSRPDPSAAKIFAQLRSIEDFEDKYQTFRKLHEEIFPACLSDPQLTFTQLEDQLKNVGIFSLSETPEHPLMWSHYGGSHEGVCLGFEVADGTPSSDRDRFIKVTYTDQIPKMDQGFRHEMSFFIDEEGRPEAKRAFRSQTKLCAP